MTLLNEALNECCEVMTTNGIVKAVILKDYDNQYALFRDDVDDILIIPLTEIRGVRFKDDDKSRDRECISRDDS